MLSMLAINRFEADQAIKGLTRAVEALWTSDEVSNTVHINSSILVS